MVTIHSSTCMSIETWAVKSLACPCKYCTNPLMLSINFLTRTSNWSVEIPTLFAWALSLQKAPHLCKLCLTFGWQGRVAAPTHHSFTSASMSLRLPFNFCFFYVGELLHHGNITIYATSTWVVLLVFMLSAYSFSRTNHALFLPMLYNNVGFAILSYHGNSMLVLLWCYSIISLTRIVYGVTLKQYTFRIVNLNLNLLWSIKDMHNKEKVRKINVLVIFYHHTWKG